MTIDVNSPRGKVRTWYEDADNYIARVDRGDASEIWKLDWQKTKPYFVGALPISHGEFDEYKIVKRADKWARDMIRRVL